MPASKHFDHFAIALSAVCVVHCLAVPLVVAVVPIAALWSGEGHFHALMLWLVVPTSVAGFGLGLRVHRNPVIAALGTAGLAALAAAAIRGHSHWPLGIELGVSLLGSASLGAAHWWNFREVRRTHRHRTVVSVPAE